MSIIAALRARLIEEPEIVAVVGGGDSARIFPLELPQGETRASLVNQVVSGHGDHHMQGASGLTKPRVQIAAVATTYAAARSLANLVKFAIDGDSGTWSYGSDSPQSSIDVQGVFFTGTELEDRAGDRQNLYRVLLDYDIWYAER